MKRICISVIPFLLAACFAQAQLHPAILSIEGLCGDGNETIKSVSPTSDGGFILGFYTNSNSGVILCDTSHTTSVFRKYDNNGILQWQRCFGNSYMFLLPCADGSFLASGFRNSPLDFYATKLDAGGNELWTRYYGGTGDEFLRDVITTPDGGFLMTGYTYSDDGDVGFHYGSKFSSDLWVIKIDSSGTKQWSKVIGGTLDDTPDKILRLSDNSIFILGSTESGDYDCTGFHGYSDRYVVRLDDTGHIKWHRCLGGSDIDSWGPGFGYGAACPDGKGGIITAGSSESLDGDVHHHIGAADNMDFWVVDVDSNGNIVWENCYGAARSARYEVAMSVCRSTDGSVWIAGSSNLSGGQVDTSFGAGDAWLVHTDSVGNLLNERVLGAGAEDQGAFVQPLSGNMVMLGGTYKGPGPAGGDFPDTWCGNSEIFLARIAPWTTGVETVKHDAGICIYPNPATDKCYIKAHAKTELHIHDVLGRLMYTGLANAEQSIDVHAWPRGLYYVQRREADNITNTQTLLLQ